MGIGALDWVVVAAYFALVIAIAVWAIRQERSGRETSADYFLAGRNVGWFVVGASLFASNIGSEHLVELAGTGAASGLVFGQLELQASLILLLLGWVFLPFYIRSGVFTMPESLERRDSPAARWYLSVVAVIVLAPRVPLDRHGLRRADHRHLVLVHRPVHRPADAVPAGWGGRWHLAVGRRPLRRRGADGGGDARRRRLHRRLQSALQPFQGPYAAVRPLFTA